ncbi:2OG-Fe(II) oxygenase, partial [Mycobacterium kansasii]
MIAHRYWVRRLKPFPHVTVQNVFNQAFYDTLEDHYRRIAAVETKFNTKTPGYDASMALIRDNLDGPLAVFTSREWHDIIAGVAGVS